MLTPRSLHHLFSKAVHLAARLLQRPSYLLAFLFHPLLRLPPCAPIDLLLHRIPDPLGQSVWRNRVELPALVPILCGILPGSRISLLGRVGRERQLSYLLYVRALSSLRLASRCSCQSIRASLELRSLDMSSPLGSWSPKCSTDDVLPLREPFESLHDLRDSCCIPSKGRPRSCTALRPSRRAC